VPALTSTGDLLHGALDMLVLKSLAPGALHGWAISQRLRDVTRDVLRVNQGSLYPALHRLEDAGLVDAEWTTSDTNRRVKVYRLTAAGRRQIGLETAVWRAFAQAVELVLRTA
jgi:PadR family transcriptional regulator, regulatory protein PadR